MSGLFKKSGFQYKLVYCCMVELMAWSLCVPITAEDLSFLNCPLKRSMLRHMIKVSDSHFVNRSDLWLSLRELMSDETFSQWTRHSFVLTSVSIS